MPRRGVMRTPPRRSGFLALAAGGAEPLQCQVYDHSRCPWRSVLRSEYRFFSAATLLALVVALVLDRLTKFWVVRTLPFEEPWAPIPALDGWLNFTYIHNTGAAFGMFPQAGTLFAVVSAVVVVCLMIWYDRLPVQYMPVRLAIGLIAGGALGNLVDRIVTGYVVDFLHFRLFAIFNIADSSVTVGVVILGIYMLFFEERMEAPVPRASLGHEQSDGC